ncbi:hypothetical protein ElyMa_002383200 [Elysia marginata]|uniref:Uncharacterized protein n=1 Tax=Elysia marginata TaxID=1093978 RepID=A0AAV4GCD1_9GAST|nr:hypothetical protein ElyMa_002383200 [Elysia marginata]
MLSTRVSWPDLENKDSPDVHVLPLSWQGYPGITDRPAWKAFRRHFSSGDAASMTTSGSKRPNQLLFPPTPRIFVGTGIRKSYRHTILKHEEEDDEREEEEEEREEYDDDDDDDDTDDDEKKKKKKKEKNMMMMMMMMMILMMMMMMIMMMMMMMMMMIIMEVNKA